ncbi:MAG: hypothetical protein GX228_01795 [Firmicutes bacterium]|nr:hypothetical protein [Bacillota bacterium]
MSRKNVVFTVILVFALTLSGCFSFLKPTLDKIVVSADAETIEQGKSVNLEVKGFDKKNKEMEVPEPQWTADPEDLGELAADGAEAVFTANDDAEGTVTITVTSGMLSDSIEITITKGETPAEPDADLDQKIAQAESLLTDTEKGIYKGQAPVHAHAELEDAVDEAKAARDKEDVTQAEVDAAVTALQQAIDDFNGQIVTEDDPKKVHTFVIDDNIDHFETQANRGTIEANTNPLYIKSGAESIFCNAIGHPFFVRVLPSHPNWIEDWREYDQLAAWFYVESADSLHNTTAIQIGYPMNTALCTFARSEFHDGWNQIVVDLRDDLGLTDEQLADMTELFEFFVRYSGDFVPVYFDEIRLLKLEEAEPVDKAFLEVAIQNATDLKGSTPVGTDPGQAPQAAHDALQQAIEAAQAVLNDDGATQAQVDNAVAALEQAMADFEDAIIGEPQDSDKTALIDAIDDAETLLNNTERGIYYGQVPVHAHAALEAAVDEAKAVRDDVSAAQAEVDDAVAALQQAIDEFENEIVTDEDPLKVYTFPIDSSDSQAFSAEKGQLTFNSDPKYIKTGTTSIKYTITGTPSDFRIRLDRKQGVWETDWTDYDYFAVWIYVEDVERLNKDVAVQWGYGSASGDVRITVPRSAFVNGWNELRFNLRDDLGFTDEDLANMTTLFQLRLRNISGEDTLYIDEIRLLKLEEAEPVDKTYLEAAIQNAVELKGSILVGTEPGQAPQEAHDALQDAIDAAQDVFGDENATQAEVDAAVDALEAAVVAFNEAIIEDPGDPPVDPKIILYEDFSGLKNVGDFWTEDYKVLPGTTDQPMYKSLGGSFSLEDGLLVLNGGRFSIGMPPNRENTTSGDTEAGGTLDLTRPYKITIEFTEVDGTLSKKFQIYIDNNTTSAGQSIHASKGETASRPYSVALNSLPANGVIEQEISDLGTDSSFVQLRVESNGIIKLKSIKIEYTD